MMARTCHPGNASCLVNHFADDTLRAGWLTVPTLALSRPLLATSPPHVGDDTGEVPLDVDEIVSTFVALERMPFQPLGLHEATQRRAVLGRAREMLYLMRRAAAQGGPSLDVERLEALLTGQLARVQAVLDRPVAVASSLGILEERWFAANPGKPLDTAPILLLLFTPTDDYSAEDWALRATCTTFLVREGFVENSPRGVRYRLLAAPAWYGAFAPTTVRTRDVLGAGAGTTTRTSVPLTDLDEAQIETLLGLWTPDALSDLLDLERVKEAVLALTRLERQEIAPG